MIDARFYDKLDEGKVRCFLCPRHCLIRPGRAGVCFVRFNEAGRLVPLTYGRVSSVQLDPVEKKPLHFFHPGAKILSVGSLGCNLGCWFCQNWQIAHPKDSTSDRPLEAVARLTEPLGVEKLVEMALEYQALGNIGVAFTYNEPFIWFEYVLDAARALAERGLKTILVTNGYVSEAPLRELLPYIDAMNIDVKGFDHEFYRRLGGDLDTVLATAEAAAKVCHVEITNLLIPGINTEPGQIEQLVAWVARSLGPRTPLHFSRYFPQRRSEEPTTPLSVLHMAEKIAAGCLDHVVLGNT